MSKEKEPQKIKISIIRQCRVGGRVVEPGKSWEADREEAKALIAAGKAKATAGLTEQDLSEIEENKAKIAAKLGAKAAEPAKKSGSGGGEDGIEAMSVKQLKDVLEANEVEYDARANKETLVELVRQIDV